MRRALPIVVAFLAALAMAQQPPPVSQRITALHQQVEVLAQGGQYAAIHGATNIMRRYGERVARDYTHFDQRLLSRAAALGMRLPASAAAPAFAASNPANFDREFITWAAQQNQQLLNTLRDAAREPTPAPLGGLARSLLPLVEVHHQLTLALQQPGAPV
ncbi:MAG TPA: DUF4142 domain-containing protein [Terriglobales bacterium]|nr:DUF4142 domain-containing protein [Terriglobales bacterium]